MSSFYKTVRSIFKPIVRVIFRLKCVGAENVPQEGPILLCSNHTSLFDIPILIALCPRQIFFMAKKEIFKVPVLSSVFKAMGAFPVDRGARDISAIRSAVSVVKNGNVLGVFPEGTRYRECGPMREVKTGSAFIAVKTGVDMVPVSIYKEGTAHPFRRVTVRFGKPVSAKTLCDGKPSKENLAAASKVISDSINEMWELKF